ncbi:MAG TPA: ATP-binding protein [Solirubrobacteraceae bacterium]
MLASPSRLQERLPALPASVSRLRGAIVALAASNGASDEQCDDIALAVSEALTNAVVHAYVGRARAGALGVDAWVTGGADSLTVEVCDEGIGMLRRADSPGLGQGLALIGRLTQRLQVEDVAPGVRLRMTFAIR